MEAKSQIFVRCFYFFSLVHLLSPYLPVILLIYFPDSQIAVSVLHILLFFSAMDDGCVKALPDLFPQCVPRKYFFHNFHIFKTLLSYLVFLYQPIPIITSPTIIATVRRMESGESKQATIIPVPAPVKNSMIDFSFFIFPV